MRVSHQLDYDTHAVIGGEEVMAMGIADTAEMYDILSNAMYSNKKMAVAREYLCNAWDSHIASGRTDQAIEVTVTDEKLIIRDQGLGIPHDRIHQTFCVYGGGSTKLNDGRQTGGFALGSKAGFAYSDHFTVTNHHAGTKVVHAISKGSALTKGRPDRRVIVSVPTTEEGLEISIPLKESLDLYDFQNLIKEIASFGEMNVVLNGRKVDIVPISKTENNMFLTLRTLPYSQYKILVRYGSVLYPVDSHEDYAGVYRAVVDQLKGMSDHWNSSPQWRLVLQAQPNTISVTPSRESLSMTETTVTTLKGLLDGIYNYINPIAKHNQDLIKGYTLKAFEQYVHKDQLFKVLTVEQPVKDTQRKDFGQDITDLDTLALFRALRKDVYTQTIEGTKLRLDFLIKHGFRRTHDLKLWRRVLDWGLSWKAIDRVMKKRIINPLLKKLAMDSDLKPENLMIAPTGDKNATDFKPVSSYVVSEDILPELFLTGVVIISYSRRSYLDDYYDRDFPNNAHRLVYLAGRTKGNKDKAVNFFKKLGYHVIDFAGQQDADKANCTPLVAAPAVKREPKPEGLPALTNLVKGKYFNRKGLSDRQKNGEIIDRVINPVCVFRPYAMTERYNPRFFQFGDDAGKQIVQLIGHEAAIATTDALYEKHIKAGMRDGNEYLVERLIREFQTNPRIRTAMEMKNTDRLQNQNTVVENMTWLLTLSSHSDILKNALKLPDKTTEEDCRFITIYGSIAYGIRHYSNYTSNKTLWIKVYQDFKAVIDSWSVSGDLAELYKKVRNNHRLAGLNLAEMVKHMSALTPSNPDYKLKTFYEISVLNALN